MYAPAHLPYEMIPIYPVLCMKMMAAAVTHSCWGQQMPMKSGLELTTLHGA